MELTQFEAFRNLNFQDNCLLVNKFIKQAKLHSNVILDHFQTDYKKLFHGVNILDLIVRRADLKFPILFIHLCCILLILGVFGNSNVPLNYFKFFLLNLSGAISLMLFARIFYVLVQFIVSNQNSRFITGIWSQDSLVMLTLAFLLLFYILISIRSFSVLPFFLNFIVVGIDILVSKDIFEVWIIWLFNLKNTTELDTMLVLFFYSIAIIELLLTLSGVYYILVFISWIIKKSCYPVLQKLYYIATFKN